ncbi:MAG: hypothetical protein UU32_C0027G0010 [Candidatus Woesebacteria bacterium GW2011_GWB1_41_10]|uniref:HicB-like antitoxin of toxin-antitoxin system domain-containing protein n=1 Tax=Candidatus Woesebacteria bacterium GW2011_GWB1_41_10 TaxID=1618577 RepID=A0A0G0UAA4_9BACT|nr:MAG: hypothetical protein UU32_C0027G0010 [Candidatus Woesebacteria bacterium GW2011_GWB1_41_10]
MIERPINTKESGLVEFLVYKEGDSYVGVCLTFDIIEEGNNPTELQRSIKEAAELHLETVIKNKLSDELLNRHAPAEYWERYFKSASELKTLSVSENNFHVASPYYSSTAAQVA